MESIYQGEGTILPGAEELVPSAGSVLPEDVSGV